MGKVVLKIGSGGVKESSKKPNFYRTWEIMLKKLFISNVLQLARKIPSMK
jgi:hypothetical protein